MEYPKQAIQMSGCIGHRHCLASSGCCGVHGNCVLTVIDAYIEEFPLCMYCENLAASPAPFQIGRKPLKRNESALCKLNIHGKVL